MQGSSLYLLGYNDQVWPWFKGHGLFFSVRPDAITGKDREGHSSSRAARRFLPGPACSI